MVLKFLICVSIISVSIYIILSYRFKLLVGLKRPPIVILLFACILTFAFLLIGNFNWKAGNGERGNGVNGNGNGVVKGGDNVSGNIPPGSDAELSLSYDPGSAMVTIKGYGNFTKSINDINFLIKYQDHLEEADEAGYRKMTLGPTAFQLPIPFSLALQQRAEGANVTVVSGQE